MEQKIDELIAYFSTSGTLSEAFAFTQALLNSAWGEVAKLYNEIQVVL